MDLNPAKSQFTARLEREHGHNQYRLYCNGEAFGLLKSERGVWQVFTVDADLSLAIRMKMGSALSDTVRDMLQAVREGIVFYYGVEDDIGELRHPDEYELLSRMRRLRKDYAEMATTTTVADLKPVVDELREIEQALWVLPYKIPGAIYG